MISAQIIVGTGVLDKSWLTPIFCFVLTFLVQIKDTEDFQMDTAATDTSSSSGSSDSDQRSPSKLEEYIAASRVALGNETHLSEGDFDDHVEC